MNKTIKYKWIINVWILLASIFLLGCTGVNTPAPKQEKLALPAITKSATHKYYSGKFVWHDLLTDDVSSAKVFYSALFGWTFEEQDEYITIYNRGKLIGGMMQVAPKPGSKAEAIWLPSMSVSNVDSMVAYVEKKKGKVLKGPLDMKERGKGVLVSDPHGAHIVLLNAKGGDPVDTIPQMGDWLWDELWTDQPKESYDFYRKLGKYDATEKRDNYRILKRKGKWRAGMRYVSRDGVNVHWVPVIRVKDPQTIVAKVVKLGGKVLVEPHKSFINGDVAIIADNTGAHLIVQRWTEGEK